MMNKRTDKRVRLIEAADKLFYEQGVNITTLANIASLAEVPLGNVYYYFKSKESIVLAVIERRRKTIEAQFSTWATLNNKERLTALIGQNTEQGEQAVAFGDWLGSLCQELCKSTNEISTAASGLLKDVLSWCETQFKEMGKGEKSHSLALSLLAGLQGTSLLTLTFKDAQVIKQQSHYLVKWLETV
ncbi:MAG TPA: TetR/AcrR family transcriptional regulator [Gammaproteobacteria bacterium]|nr:TetR/AcrR family transcriptional regulator [Gammaproteobacteria bacterium]